MELGIYTFVDLPLGVSSMSPHQRVKNLIEQAELADEVGLDVLGIGEHHRPDFVSSAPAVMLAAIATRTRNIRLTSAVTVLSSDDPVRVFQQFSSLDLLSDGRAEIMAGRGSFTESFPLFGFDLADYSELFSEKLALLLQIREQEHVAWTGKHRAPLADQGIYPRPLQDPLPIWVAVGGTASSAARAGTLGLPMALAIIGGTTPRFVPIADHYRTAAVRAGHDASQARVSLNTLGYIADTSQQAIAEHFPHFEPAMARIARERGFAPPNMPQYVASTAVDGAYAVGSPEQVAEKILFQHEIFGNDRMLMQMDLGTMDHAHVMRSIELFGTRVAPIVRGEVERRKSPAEDDQPIAL